MDFLGVCGVGWARALETPDAPNALNALNALNAVNSLDDV
jgi:hypothetical protein